MEVSIKTLKYSGKITEKWLAVASPGHLKWWENKSQCWKHQNVIFGKVVLMPAQPPHPLDGPLPLSHHTLVTALLEHAHPIIALPPEVGGRH